MEKKIKKIGSMQATGNVSVKGNLTTSDFTAADVSFSEQLNSSFKISSDVLKYSNGYIEDLYVDIIEGLDVIYFLSSFIKN